MTTHFPALPAGPAVGSARSWMWFLTGFALLCGVLLGTSAVDATGRWGVAILAATLLAALVVEGLHRPRPIPEMLRDLGFGRPIGRALAVAAAVSCLVVLVFPATAAISGANVELRQMTGSGYWSASSPSTGWPKSWCGEASPSVDCARAARSGPRRHGRCRSSRPVTCTSCSPSALLSASAPWQSPWSPRSRSPISTRPAGTRSGRPPCVHTAIDTFKLVIIPTAALATFSVLIIAVSLTVPLLALAVPRRLLQPSANEGFRKPDPGRRAAGSPAPTTERGTRQ